MLEWIASIGLYGCHQLSALSLTSFALNQSRGPRLQVASQVGTEFWPEQGYRSHLFPSRRMLLPLLVGKFPASLARLA